MKKISIIFFFLASLISAANSSSHDDQIFRGSLNKSIKSATIFPNNFEGHLVFIQDSEGPVPTKTIIRVKDNIFSQEFNLIIEGDEFQYLIETKLDPSKLKQKLITMNVTDQEGNTYNLKYEKINGISANQMFDGLGRLITGDDYTYYLNTPKSIRFSKILRKMGYDNRQANQLEKELGIKYFSTTYIGQTCYKNRKTLVLEFDMDRKPMGYQLHDLVNGQLVGGVLKGFMGIKENLNQSYFVDVPDNCVSKPILGSESNNLTKDFNIEEKIKRLKNMLDKGLISQNQYDEKSSKILDDF